MTTNEPGTPVQMEMTERGRRMIERQTEEGDYRTAWPFSARNPRPDCRNGDGRPVYLAGLCGACYAATGEPSGDRGRIGRALADLEDVEDESLRLVLRSTIRELAEVAQKIDDGEL